MNHQSQAEIVFFAALERATPAERAVYLDEACAGNDELRRRVEALLAAHPLVGQFLEHPVVQAEGVAALELENSSSADWLGFLAPTSKPNSLGRIGHYEVLEVLGKGGFGIVVRAFDEILQRVVAIKVLNAQIAATSPARKRFLREARSSAKVRHENVVQVYAVEEQPLPYLVMEFIPGETLQQRLDRTGPLDTVEVAQIGRQIAEGLAAAHAEGLIHRDIKPGNILIEAGPKQCVKITDFGIARAVDDASMTQSGLIGGTPMFMSPEQAKGENLDHRTDLFSLGSVLYTACAGRVPFRANGTYAILKRVAEDTPRPIQEIIPEVPQWFCDIVKRLHANKPSERIATAREVAELLARGIGDTQAADTFTLAEIPPVAQSMSVPAVPSKPAKQNRFPAARWAVAAAILVMFASIGFTEATGVTALSGAVVRLFSPEGTLIIEVDDPAVSVTIDGSDLVISGAGAKEIRLKPGRYTVEASKDGELVSRELINVTNNGRQVVRVRQEATTIKTGDGGDAWELSVADLPAIEQANAVGARLKDLNLGFDGEVIPVIENDVVTGLQFFTDQVTNINPVRALTGLRTLQCSGTNAAHGEVAKGQLRDLTPLKGMKLTSLDCRNTQVEDIEPLKGMPLISLNMRHTQVHELVPLKSTSLTNLSLHGCQKVTDLTPLEGMQLTSLDIAYSGVQDLTPLQGMPLTSLVLWQCRGVSSLEPLRGMKLDWLDLERVEQISDLTPLKGMPLTWLSVAECPLVTDLAPLQGMQLTSLRCFRTGVTDLEPLEGMPLEFVSLPNPHDIQQGLDLLRDMPTVKTIGTLQYGNEWPAAVFWDRYDKGEFKN